MAATDIIGMTIVPIIVINAIGLLGLVMQNRYGRIKDRIYKLIKGRNELLSKFPERQVTIQNTEKLLTCYLKEMKLIKNAMLHAFLSIVFVVLTCFLIMVSSYTSSDPVISSFIAGFLPAIETSILLVFGMSLILLLLCVLSMSRSLLLSIATVSFEIEKWDD